MTIRPGGNRLVLVPALLRERPNNFPHWPYESAPVRKTTALAAADLNSFSAAASAHPTVLWSVGVAVEV
jgi:hypothetical protein